MTLSINDRPDAQRSSSLVQIGNVTGPFKFTAEDLDPDRMIIGVDHTLNDFYSWRDHNPDLIAAHLDLHMAMLERIVREHGIAARTRCRLSAARREAWQADRHRREIGFFCVYNLAEVPDAATIERFRRMTTGRAAELGIGTSGPKGIEGMIATLKAHIPALRTAPELAWLREQMHRLHRILPEPTIRVGGIGKAAKTVVGILTIAAYDTLDEDLAVQKEHLTRILPAAYAFGAMYPIIDDTLQDGSCIPERDRRRYHEAILEGIRTGRPTNAAATVDHPLADELARLHKLLLDTFPFDENRRLYHAGEAMYLAQERDSRKKPEDVRPYGVAGMYPDLFVKAGMSRVISNIIGRRALAPDYYARSLNTNFFNQLRDDLADRDEDSAAGRLTPFTYQLGPHDTNPLYDLFAYSAYVAHEVYGNDPVVTEALTMLSDNIFATDLISHPVKARYVLDTYGTTDALARFIRYASGLPHRMTRHLARGDTTLVKTVDHMAQSRSQTDIDPRTFVSDRAEYINGVLGRAIGSDSRCRLNAIVRYAVEGGGKRLRPALSLMLAESLGMPYKPIEPVLAAIELFHTCSLVFDDLPAQDDATLRRGKPAAHIEFGEAGAQLAGISMISSGFGVLADLSSHYPGDLVGGVIRYIGTLLGSDHLCRGQDMDLRMERGTAAITIDTILEMYRLKTSTALEAALIPIMMLARRPHHETELIRRYANHAGIVFQIRDDILDMTADADTIGKNRNSDGNKVNLARTCGIETAQRMMRRHVELAVNSCKALPYNTNLLQGLVEYFAVRAR